MSTIYKTLILGASYGSLLATKLVLAGHTVVLVCRQTNAELINREGTRVRFPVKGRDGLVEVDSRSLPGSLSAATPESVDVSEFDLVVLAMQEPQYGSPEVGELLASVAKCRIPCMSVMNMPPLPYLARIPGIDIEGIRRCYTDPAVWDGFDPALITLCSPDPQAFRLADEGPNVLQVSLPTNFKVSRFDSAEHSAILEQMQADIEAARFQVGEDWVELPVKLKVHDSVFTPLAKWSMLLAGNYRCVQQDDVCSIRDAIHSDLEKSRSVYNWVNELCGHLGASETDQVPFEKYAKAANGLSKPSSTARALRAGVTRIERADYLVRTIAAQQGRRSDVVDKTVALVDGWIERNRMAA